MSPQRPKPPHSGRRARVADDATFSRPEAPVGPTEPAAIAETDIIVPVEASVEQERQYPGPRPIVLSPEQAADIREALAAADLIQQRYALGTVTWGDVREYSDHLYRLLRTVLTPGFSSYEPRWNEPEPTLEQPTPADGGKEQEPVP